MSEIKKNITQFRFIAVCGFHFWNQVFKTDGSNSVRRTSNLGRTLKESISIERTQNSYNSPRLLLDCTKLFMTNRFSLNVNDS